MNWQTFWESPCWDYFDKIGIAAALVAMVFSILVWLHQKRRERCENALVTVKLYCAEYGQSYVLPSPIRRKDLTRAEILGLLGMLPMRDNGQRYNLSGVSSQPFLAALENAQVDSRVGEVRVPCSMKELEQFDLGQLAGLRQDQVVNSAGLAVTGVTYFISRHAGAAAWAESEGFHVDRQLAHFDVESVMPGDTVLGTLPVNLVAAVNARGGRYFHLTLELPAEARGRELSADDMRRYGARLECYSARKQVLPAG
ncbi:MAG: CRISPR-associated protein Csx16 [Thiothrix sp.]|nr:CRISPR-associated protein Csx16 [Thiothrix sp.]HPE60797.1 CRISPR-associated protein Csx16 [Thiolinea sp.]